MFKKSCIFHSLMDFQIGRHTVCHKLFPWDVLCRWKDVTYFIIYHSIFLGAQACVLAFSTVDRDSFEAIESWKKKVSTEGYSCFLCVCLLEPCHNEHLPLHAFKWKCFVNRNLKSGVWERNYIATASLKIVGLLFTVAEKWGLVFNTPPKESFNDDILKSCKYFLMVQKRKNYFWGNLYLFVNIFCYDHRYMSWFQVTDLKFMDDIMHKYIYKHII